MHGCGQYESIARQGRWGSSFLSGHRTSASYWPLPALQNVSKRLSPSTACTEVGSFLGEVPYREVAAHEKPGPTPRRLEKRGPDSSSWTFFTYWAECVRLLTARLHHNCTP